MIDKITNTADSGASDSAGSLRACAYDSMRNDFKIGSLPNGVDKPIDHLIGNLTIVGEQATGDLKKGCPHGPGQDSAHKDSPEQGGEQVALDLVPGSTNYGIGFTSTGSMVMGPMKDGKMLGGGRVVISPQGGLTLSPTLLLTGPPKV